MYFIKSFMYYNEKEWPFCKVRPVIIQLEWRAIMKEYNEQNQLVKIKCNICTKEIKLEQ